MAGPISDARDPDEPRIEIRSTPEDVSALAAEIIAEALTAAVQRRGRADWATTGGSTPVGIYTVLGEPRYRDSVPWDRVHLWWGDDRFVPRDHPYSNVLPLDQILLRATALAGLSGQGDDATDVSARIEPGVLIPAANVHAMPMTAAIAQGRDPAWVAETYDAELRNAGLPTAPGADPATAVPSLDLVLVGMGPDGHVFSVFPNSTAFAPDTWVAPVDAPTHVEPHVARVSLAPSFLAAARSVLVVVHGEAKAEILSTVLGETRDPERWPIQHARRRNATWLLDAAAAANLPDR